MRSATAAAANATVRTARPDIVAEAEAGVNDAHAEAVETFLAANGISAGDVDRRSASTARPCCTGPSAA